MGDRERRKLIIIINIKKISIFHRFTKNLTVGRSLCMCCPERGGLNDYSFAGTRSENCCRQGSCKNVFRGMCIILLFIYINYYYYYDYHHPPLPLATTQGVLLPETVVIGCKHADEQFGTTLYLEIFCIMTKCKYYV